MGEYITIINGNEIDILKITTFYRSNRNILCDTVEHFTNYYELNSNGIFAAVSNTTGEILGIHCLIDCRLYFWSYFYLYSPTLTPILNH